MNYQLRDQLKNKQKHLSPQQTNLFHRAAVLYVPDNQVQQMADTKNISYKKSSLHQDYSQMPISIIMPSIIQKNLKVRQLNPSESQPIPQWKIFEKQESLTNGEVVQMMYAKKTKKAKEHKRRLNAQARQEHPPSPGSVKMGSKTFACFNIDVRYNEDYISANFSQPYPTPEQLIEGAKCKIITMHGTYSGSVFQIDRHPQEEYLRANINNLKVKK